MIAQEKKLKDPSSSTWKVSSLRDMGLGLTIMLKKNVRASINTNQGHEEVMLQDRSAKKPSSGIAMKGVAEFTGVMIISARYRRISEIS